MMEVESVHYHAKIFGAIEATAALASGHIDEWAKENMDPKIADTNHCCCSDKGVALAQGVGVQKSLQMFSR